MYKFLITTSMLTLGLGLYLPAQEETNSADDLAKQASERRELDTKARRTAADSHYKMALKLYEDHITSDKSPKKEDLQKAREHLINSLTYVGDHEKARKLLSKVNANLGTPEDKANELLTRKSQAHTAFNQQQEIEVKQSIAEAQQMIKTLKYNEAIRKLDSILEVLEFLPYHINVEGYRKEVSLLSIEAKSRKRREEQRIKIEQDIQAEEQAKTELYKNTQVRRNRIYELRKQADDRYAAHDYIRAIDLYKVILKIDPHHIHSKQMVELAHAHMGTDEMANAETSKYINRLVRENFDNSSYIIADPNHPVSFVDDFRQFTKKRIANNSNSTRSSEEDWKTRLRGILDKPATFPFENQPLEQIITKLGITYDVIIDTSSEIDRDQIIDNIPVVNLTFKQVLNILISKIDGDEIGWTLKHGTISIGPASDSDDEFFIVNYDVRDLIAVVMDYAGPQITMVQADATGAKIEEMDPEEEPPSGDELIDLLKAATGETKWDSASSSIEYRNGSIVVSQNPEIHEKIDEILSSMRAQRNLQVTVQARFLRLDTLDLDFIGMDYYGLDRPPLSPFQSDGILNGVPANDNVNNISNPLGFLSPTSGRDLLRGRLQNFVGLTYTIDDANNGVRLNEGMAFTFEYLNDIQVAGLLRAVSSKRHANFLTAPMLTCFNTQRASVTVLTQQAYIRDLTAVAQTGAALFDPEIGYIQTGTSLDVRPIVSHDRKYVTLDLRPTVARLERVDVVTNNPSLGGNLISGASQIELPVISFRAIRTTASVPDRGSLLIGGFATGTDVEDYAGIPFISKIPVLNFFFGSNLKHKEQLNDYMLVKATIVSQTQLEEDIFGIN